jgi:large subunit ribosomal protein L30
VTETKKTARADAGREKKPGGATVTVRLVRSGICTPKDQKETLRGIGFRRMGQSVTRDDTPALRGMLRKVRHLVDVTKG